jgi:hypothetical protein
MSFRTDVVYKKLNVLELIRNNDFRFCIKAIVFFQLNMNDLCCDVLHNGTNFAETVDRPQAVRSERMLTEVNPAYSHQTASPAQRLGTRRDSRSMVRLDRSNALYGQMRKPIRSNEGM